MAARPREDERGAGPTARIGPITKARCVIAIQSESLSAVSVRQIALSQILNLAAPVPAAAAGFLFGFLFAVTLAGNLLGRRHSDVGELRHQLGFTSFSERSGEEAVMRSLSKLMDEAV